MKAKTSQLIANRLTLLNIFKSIPDLGEPYGSNDANFILIPVLERGGNKPDTTRALKVYKSLAEENGVVVRFRGSELGCAGCLRITVGSEEENKVLVEKLQQVLSLI